MSGRNVLYSIALATVAPMLACGDESPSSSDTEANTDESTTSDLDPSTPTWHRDVRPIVEVSCVRCHEPDNIAPFALTSYDAAWPWAAAMADAVEARIMPPWLTNPDCADYDPKEALTDDQIAIIAAWADARAPEGDPADYLAPEEPNRPFLSRVDLSLTMAEAYVPRQSPDDYRCFLLDWPETKTRYITGFQAIPGQIDIVHHVIAYGGTPQQAAAYDQLDADEDGPGYTCFGGPGGSSNNWLGSWAPGGQGTDYPAGTGLRMEPGSKIILQVHYNTLAQEPIADSTRIDLRIDDTVDREAVIVPFANPSWVSGGMMIPAGDPDVRHVMEVDLSNYFSYLNDVLVPGQPIDIHWSAHHMHTLGKVGIQAIRHSDGIDECLIDIARWDFHWQQGYRFAEPRRYEPGDKFYMECRFDNSAGKQDVNWGEGTQDEMCLAVFYATVSQ